MLAVARVIDDWRNRIALNGEADRVWRRRYDVRLAMRAPAAKCAPDDNIVDALARMTRDRIRYLLVVDGEAVLGLVSIGDLVKARLESTELESRALRDMARGRLLAGA